jgi:hypothetical protein
MTSLLTLLY